MRISQLAKDRTTLRLTAAEDGSLAQTPEGSDPDLTIVYSAAGYTLEVEERLEAISETSFQNKAVALMLEELVVEWNLEDEWGRVIALRTDDVWLPVETGEIVPDGVPTQEIDGKKCKLAQSGLRRVPLSILIRVMQAIREASRPSSEEGKTSADGSHQTETSATAPTGTE